MDLALIVVVATAAAMNAAPVSGSLEERRAAMQERILEGASERARFRAEEAFPFAVRGGMILEDARTDAYLSGVLTRLFPDGHSALRAQLWNSDDDRAFVTAAGVILLPLGLIARVEDEAQLAFHLAESGERYLGRHIGAEILADHTSTSASHYTPTNSTSFTLGAAVALAVLAALERQHGAIKRGILAAEAEADAVARIRRAGYSQDSIHGHLARMDWTSRRTGRLEGGGETGRDRYLAALGRYRIDGLERIRIRGEHETLLRILDDGDESCVRPSSECVYLAEAHRLSGNASTARQLFERILDRTPESALAHRGLALIARADGNDAEWNAHAARYRQLAPSAVDVEFFTGALQ